MAFGDDITVKIGGKSYPVTQLLNKTVYAARDTNLYRYTSDPNVADFHVKKGLIIGKVYSWSMVNGVVWLMFQTQSPSILAKYPLGNYYVKLNDISDSTLTDQGTKTQSQVTKEAEEKAKKAAEESKSFFDNPFGNIGNLAKWGLGAIVVIELGKAFISSRGNN